tara:strand:- start:2047 stop:2655 length:609 start_codon:yes stop_codon:yes gene_type:complete
MVAKKKPNTNNKTTVIEPAYTTEKTVGADVNQVGNEQVKEDLNAEINALVAKIKELEAVKEFDDKTIKTLSSETDSAKNSLDSKIEENSNLNSQLADEKEAFRELDVLLNSERIKSQTLSKELEEVLQEPIPGKFVEATSGYPESESFGKDMFVPLYQTTSEKASVFKVKGLGDILKIESLGKVALVYVPDANIKEQQNSMN